MYYNSSPYRLGSTQIGPGTPGQSNKTKILLAKSKVHSPTAIPICPKKRNKKRYHRVSAITSSVRISAIWEKIGYSGKKSRAALLGWLMAKSRSTMGMVGTFRREQAVCPSPRVDWITHFI
jgi:hypothetical protein